MNIVDTCTPTHHADICLRVYDRLRRGGHLHVHD
jgi:hypothetical protein